MSNIIVRYLDEEFEDILSLDKETLRIESKKTKRHGSVKSRGEKLLLEISWDDTPIREYFILRGPIYFYVGNSESISDDPLILISMVDGLGNQMFQYAFGLYLKKLGKNVKIDPRWYRQSNSYRKELLSCFDLLGDIPFCSKTESALFPLVKEEHNKDKLNFNTDWENFNQELNLFGYWQDYRFISSNEEYLKKAFKLKKELNEPNKHWLNKIKNKNSVMVHVRRGDYFNYPERYNILDASYYKKAIDIISEKVENPEFFFFGTDLKWIEENLIDYCSTYNIVDCNLEKEEDCVFDLELMKNCKHQIIANSTFSLWSAVLNDNKDQIVVAPKEWGDSFNEYINNEEWITI